MSPVRQSRVGTERADHAMSSYCGVSFVRELVFLGELLEAELYRHGQV